MGRLFEVTLVVKASMRICKKHSRGLAQMINMSLIVAKPRGIVEVAKLF